jgi:hypothetical protein
MIFSSLCYTSRRKLLVGGAAMGGLLLAGRILERKYLKVKTRYEVPELYPVQASGLLNTGLIL